MYIAWRIENDREEVCKKVFLHLLGCEEDELDDELSYQGINFDEITDEQLYATIVENDIDI